MPDNDAKNLTCRSSKKIVIPQRLLWLLNFNIPMFIWYDRSMLVWEWLRYVLTIFKKGFRTMNPILDLLTYVLNFSKLLEVYLKKQIEDVNNDYFCQHVTLC